MINYEKLIEETLISNRTFNYAIFSEWLDQGLYNEIISLFYQSFKESKLSFSSIYRPLTYMFGIRSLKDFETKLNNDLGSYNGLSDSRILSLINSPLNKKEYKIFCKDITALMKTYKLLNIDHIYEEMKCFPIDNVYFESYILFSLIRLGNPRVREEDKLSLFELIKESFSKLQLFLFVNAHEIKMNYTEAYKILDLLEEYGINTTKEYALDLLDFYIQKKSCFSVISDKKTLDFFSYLKIDIEPTFNNFDILRLFLNDNNNDCYFKRKIEEHVSKGLVENLAFTAINDIDIITINQCRNFKILRNKIFYLKELGISDFFSYKVNRRGYNPESDYRISIWEMKMSDKIRITRKSISIKNAVRFIEEELKDSILDYYNDDSKFLKIKNEDFDLLELNLSS
tara:strand:+ start:28003 stop:29199 length:1197 start_codon:yes stop_codon:yes gene_type:complete